MTKPQPSITCPQCGMTSYHPDDIAEGYCANCMDWTQPYAAVRERCPLCFLPKSVPNPLCLTHATL